jgi:hypothetical protein
MLLYLAGIGSANKDFIAWLRETYPDIGALTSYITAGQYKKLQDWGFADIMVDSGAYSAWNSGTPIDIDALAEFFLGIQDDPGTVCVGLDVIGDVNRGWDSARNWNTMRDKGVKCIPTFHAGEDWDVLDYYAERTDFIGYGGIAGQGHRWKDLVGVIEKAFVRYPHVKWHLFGINDVRVVSRFAAYSCDALTWRSGSRFGQIITTDGRWWVSPRNSRRATDAEVEAAGIGDWMRSRGLPYPFPEDFDFKRLDRVNVRTLYESLVLHEDKSDVTYPQTLF